MSKSQTIDVNVPKKLFNDTYLKYLDDNTRIQILFGGSSSGKSVFLAQRAVRDLCNGGRNFLIVRNVGASIKSSVFNEIKKIINRWGLNNYFQINLSDLVITCANGHQMIFKGLDDPEKIKSITAPRGVITDIWIEEATEIAENDFNQLSKRLRGVANVPKRIVLSFNPILKTHWIYKRFFNYFGNDDTEYRAGDLTILKTTYKDNQFLAPDDIKALEDEKDEYFYQVYTLGNWGILGDLVFKNWKMADIRSDPIFQTFDYFKCGLDFGFSNNPTAFNRSYYHRATKKIYIIEEWTALDVTNDMIAANLKPKLNGYPVICDSAEPKSIKELQNLGINAIGAKKGKDSIDHGIQWLKQQEIIVDISCQQMKNNLEQYQWQKDKNGDSLNVPVDRHNDQIDALRYAYESEMLMGDGGKPIAGGERLSTQGRWD